MRNLESLGLISTYTPHWSMRCNGQIKPVSADPFKLSLCTSLVYILALMHPHVALSSPEFQVHLVAHMKSHTSHRR